MLDQTQIWLVLAIACSVLGAVGIAWSRTGGAGGKRRWGRRLLISALVTLGLIGAATAFDPHHAVQYFGLAVALLVIGMIWEGPAHTVEPQNLAKYHY
jgi:hypothetical protein